MTRSHLRSRGAVRRVVETALAVADEPGRLDGPTAKGLLLLLDELQALGVGFVSLREGFDLGTPAGRLMAEVLASVAAYETEVR